MPKPVARARPRAFIPAALLIAAPSAVTAAEFDCPVTIPAGESIPGPFEAGESRAWYGSDSLAVLITTSGQWRGMSAEHNYRNKQWWWSEGYDWQVERGPDLVVTGRRLDDESVTADVSRATNAMRDDWQGTVMLVGVEFPTTGCWELRGEYKGQVVTFVVQVPYDPSR